jgi:hypothetical protein
LIQLGNEIGGEAAGDKFGQSVLLPSDGARCHDGQSTNSGHICLLDEAVVAWSPLGNVPGRLLVPYLYVDKPTIPSGKWRFLLWDEEYYIIALAHRGVSDLNNEI